MNDFISKFFAADNGSMRRYLIGLPAMALLALNVKFNLGLDTTGQALIAGIAIAMITGSNAKDIVQAHADGKVEAAKAAAAPMMPSAPDTRPTPPAPAPTVS